MSLMRTLAMVAVGVAATKGAKALANRGSGGGAASAGGGLLDALRGQAAGGANRSDLGALLGGRTGGAGGAGAGGLGGLLNEFGGAGAAGGLGQLLGGGRGGAATAGGGLGALLGGGSGSGGGGGALGALLGGGGAAAALGGLLGGGGSGGNSGGNAPDFGARLNETLATGREPAEPPTPDEEAMAALMLRGMIMAVKADGRIDQTEREMLLGQLDDLDAEERQFVMEELRAEIDLADFARDVPDHPGLRAQIFAAAMSAIDVDSEPERMFAEDLASALGLDTGMRQHVQRRMSGRYGEAPTAPWQMG